MTHLDRLLEAHTDPRSYADKARVVKDCEDVVAREVHDLHPTDHALALRELSRTFDRWAQVVEQENDQQGVPER